MWPTRPILRVLVATVLGFAIGDQLVMSSRIYPVGGSGYEKAAAFVTANRLGDSVLYAATVDTGYFVFFTRKHDPQREMVVLRADKLLTTSRMRKLDFERRISTRNELPSLLRRYGVGYVVLEDHSYPAGPLRWLQDATKTPEFKLRHRIDIKSNDRRLGGSSISIYEYLARAPADPTAILTMNLPLVQRTLEVPLADLIGPSHAQGP